MSDIQFPTNTTIINAIDLIPNSQNELAIIDDTYSDGVSIYIANNSPFTTALINLEVIPNANTNINYEPLYSNTIFLRPQQVLIISNLFNSQNTIINATIDNCNNAVAYVVYNEEFVALENNSVNTLPILALVNETVSSSPSTSGTSENYSTLQAYVTDTINSLTSDVSNLSSIIIDNFSQLLDSENFQEEVTALSSEVQSSLSSITLEVNNLSSYIEATVPLIRTFLDVTAPQLSSRFDLLSNQVLANYQTFTSDINELNIDMDSFNSNISNLSSDIDSIDSQVNTLSTELSNLTNFTSNTSSNILSLESEISQLSSTLDSEIPFISSAIDSINAEVIGNSESISSVNNQINNISATVNDNTVSIDNITSEIANINSSIESLSSSVSIENISLLETNVNTLFKNLNTLEGETSGYQSENNSNIAYLSSTSNVLSSDIENISGSLTNGTLTPKFDYIQRQVDRNSQNWLPNSTFLYGLLMWNSNVSEALATTDTQMTSLTYQSTDLTLQKIQSNPITAKWINASNQIFSISAQISAKVTSSTPTLDVLCYDANNNLLGSACTLEASIGTDYSYYSYSGTLIEGTTSVVIELGFSGDTNVSYVGFSEIKFEFNKVPTQWSDESSSLIINNIYSNVFSNSSIVDVIR